jgi:type VI protein secretion system component VasF
MNKTDLHLDEENWELQLQRALAEIPPDPAPARLRRTLRRIPQQQRRESRTGWFMPRWAFAVSALPLLMAFYLFWGSTAQDDREIAQGRRDLAVALTYLTRANQ